MFHYVVGIRFGKWLMACGETLELHLWHTQAFAAQGGVPCDECLFMLHADQDLVADTNA